MFLKMDIEISCKGHCESFSQVLDLVSCTGIGYFQIKVSHEMRCV